MTSTSSGPTGVVHASNISCRNCGKAQTLSIQLSDGRGGPQLTMTSCSRCEHRQWTHACGEVVDGHVLEVLSGRAEFTLVPAAGRRRRRKP